MTPRSPVSLMPCSGLLEGRQPHCTLRRQFHQGRAITLERGPNLRRARGQEGGNDRLKGGDLEAPPPQEQPQRGEDDAPA